MISGISGGRYLQVDGGGPTYVSKNYSGNQYMAGDMRYDLESQCIKVFDGANWQTLVGTYPSINLNAEAQSLLDWAREKRNEEQRIKALSETHPAVADALEAVKKAQEQVRIVTALIDTE